MRGIREISVLESSEKGSEQLDKCCGDIKDNMLERDRSTSTVFNSVIMNNKDLIYTVLIFFKVPL